MVFLECCKYQNQNVEIFHHANFNYKWDDFFQIFVEQLNIVFVSGYDYVGGVRERVTDVIYKNSGNIYNLLKNLESSAAVAQTVVHPVGNFESFHNCQNWWEKMRY